MKPTNVLILPGWNNSDPEHWQSRWQISHGYRRVEQHDWTRPLRGDWIARLEEVLLECDEPALLVAHSLGCIQVAAWAAHSRNTHLVRAALLAAPPDVERDDIRQIIHNWSPVSLQRLRFPSVLLASDNDAFCSVARSELFAAAWGSTYVPVGSLGHLNSDSGLGDWPQGHHVLLGLGQLE